MLDQKRPPREIVEDLYARCLCRKPTAEESARLQLAVAGSKTDQQQVLTDVFWALLNTKELIFTH